METIKFKGNYKKLHGQTSAVLICVFTSAVIDKFTSQELIKYDTKKSDGSKYDLKYGNYYQLFFVGNFGIPFSTFRKRNKENKKYCDMLGKKFEIRVV